MAADSITSFTVERSPDQTTWTTIATLGGKVRSYDDATVPNPTLYYRLTGHTFNGVTIPYNIVSVMQNVGVPTGLNGTATSCGPVQLTWNNNGAVSYNIYRNGAKVLSSLTNSVADACIAASTSYAYTVTAVDGAGLESGNSAVFNITTPACTDTNSPTGLWLAPANGSTVSGTITCTIRVNDDKSVGKVAVFLSNLGSYTLLGPFCGNGSTQADITFTIDTLPLANESHLLVAQAYDIAGNKSDNVVLSFTSANVNLDPGNMTFAHDIGISPAAGGECTAQACKVAPSGNVVVAGKFSGTVNFNGTSKTSAGGYDGFLGIYDSSGNLVSIKTFGGLYDNVPTGLAVDSTGNIFVVGYLTGTMTIDGITVTSGAGTNNNDIFVFKFNPTGTAIWGKSNFSGFGSVANAVAVNSAGDVFVAGNLVVRANFGGGDINSYASVDGFVVRFAASNGAYVWANHFGGTGYDVCSGVTIDNNGDAYVCGFTTSSTMEFGGGPKTNQGGGDGYLAKYSGPSGAHIWSRLVGGAGNDTVDSIAFDSDNNGVFIGTFTQAITIDGINLAAPQSSALMICKFSQANGVVSQARGIGGYSSTGGSIGSHLVTVDSSKNIIVTGIASGECDWGNGQLTAGTGNIYIAKYSPTIGYLWAKRFSSTGWSAGQGLAVDSSRNIYSTGGFAGTANFDAIQLNTVSAQIRDGYLLKTTP